MPGFSLSNSKLPPSPSTRRFKSPKSPSDSKASRADKPSPTSTRDGEMTLAAVSHDRQRDAAMDRRASHPPPTSNTSVSMRPSKQGSANHGKEDSVVPQAPRRSASDDPASMVSTGASANPTSQQQLSDYREKLARDLERRELSARGLLGADKDKSRISPIQEEAAFNSPLLNSGLTTTSTESGNTIRGGITPAPIAGTPSYPFPRMGYPGFNYGYMASSLHRPFTTLSPTGAQEGTAGLSRAQDKVLSGNTTPASNVTFFPSGASPFPENFDFPTPNLYDLSLMLSAEPGLDAWWNTVVHIMKDVYRAERVTLSVPADATDLENVPWGQKATYNEHQEDELSLGYMAQASSAKRSSDPDLSDVLSQEDLASPRFHVRPGMHSRHSFTSFEDNKEREQDQPTQGSLRPSYLTRSRSHLTTSTDLRNAAEAPQLDSDALEEHDAEVVQAIPSWEEPLMARNQGKGRLLPVLQALDYEADPLIDHSGVMRVLERGTTVALTRSYPYLSNPPPPETQAGQSAANKTTQTEGSNKGRQKGPEPTPNLASILSGSSTRNKRTGPSEKAKSKSSRKEEDAPKVSTPNYEEFEQAPPSPWSQSPAPSPAVRADPKENPFFTDATVDEDSFNPGSAPADYAGMRPPEAIGVENSWTVLHIPLSHVLLSSAPPPFRLDPAAMESRSANASKQGTGPDPRSRDTASPLGGKSTKAAPIAILSILSPFIPYPSSLRHSLEHLAPHMATSFSLCRHYSNLETELAGMQRRRPPTTGFGAVAPDGRPLDTTIFVTSEDIARQQSLPGSMTSPSDYSGVSKSVTGSPADTPGWEHGSFSYIMDKRNVASPAAVTGGGESYFSSKQKSTLSSSGPSRSGSKDTSPSEKKTSRPSTSKAVTDLGTTDETPEILSEEALGGIAQGTRTTYHQDLSEPSATTFAVTPSGEHLGEALRLDRLAQQAGHTKLHSYGADFASTFQSLPPSSTVGTRPTMPLSRPSSFAPGPADMPPPSDRLKGLILDSLPAHVFVALPQSGEIVWVNSRFLSYRGQTVSDLTVDPWGSIHADDRGEYLKSWSHSLRTGEQFSRTVRIKRFDGAYRWFYARAVASKDKRGVIMQFLGSYMDIHDQHIAELKAARQEEIAASNAKHHLLANLIPQIIFTATEEDGITFANEQWLSYTGQSLEDSLGLGFMDFVHPEDLARCRIPVQQPIAASHTPRDKAWKKEPETSSDSASTGTVIDQQQSNEAPSSRTRLQSLSRENSSGSSSIYEMSAADLTELARSGVIKVGTDSDGRPSYTTEVRLRSKSGEYRWHLIRCVEIDTIDFGSGASSYFGSATDINDHKLLEAKLKEAMESKGRFLSNMSHEIRTPLIGISGMVTFLQDTKLNDEQLDYTNTIQTSANSLIMIINDILDLSKVDAGMMKLNYEWFHARSLIEDVNELVSTMAIAKRLELNYLVESDVPAWVKGDKVRIRQVLLNVIGNAIKFTSEGEVFSHCKVLQTEDHETGHPEIALEFSVIDTGRGFSEEEAALIFKPFSQIDTSSTRQHGGSGLGLVISKQLVELHGGHMEGKAVLGKGSTFTFSARFGLPTVEDHPHQPGSPNSTMYSAASRQLSTESVPGSIKPLPAPKHLRNTTGSSPSGTDLGFTSPGVTSTGSSEPSVHSARSHVTDRSSNTSVNTGLARFSEAAKASGQDITHMKLEMPSEKSSPGGTATPATHGQLSPEEFRPPMYSILIICPQLHSREATGQHIETTLPKDVPRQITALGSVQEAQKYIGGDDPINFTHIVINLPSPESILSLLEQIAASQKLDKTAVLILSDSVQRQEVMKLAADSDHEEFLSENLVNFIYKPVKPSRFAVIFDPNRERDVSIDRNKSTAQQLVEAQKASYEEIQKLVVNKGHRVLLVEDNPVNQKVLLKYLQKIGVGVDVAVDGVECTDKVLSKPHKHYSLILCDLHMPRKDGYQTCREIRQWERVAHYPKMPIIALSADVLADVQHKCVAAGFSDYVAKPVDFIELGKAMIQVFDPKAQPRTRN